MKKIVFTRANDGGVSIATPTPKEKIEEVLGEMTQAEYEAHILSFIPGDALTPTYIDDDAIPGQEEMFYAAWKQNHNKIEIDLPKAKEIQLGRIRKIRDQKLKDLDVEYIKADETNDAAKKTAVKAEKQRLRDITNSLKDLVPESIEDIKSAFPEELING